jgi:hypothetical protein
MLISKLMFVAIITCGGAIAAFGQTNDVVPFVIPLNQTNGPIPLPRPKMPRQLSERIMGTLVKVDSTNLIIHPRQGPGTTNDTILATDSRSEFRIDGVRGKLSDLRPGMRVMAVRFGPAEQNSRVAVVADSPAVTGELMKTDGAKLVLRVTKPGAAPTEMTISTDEKTQFHFLGAVVNGKTSGPHEGKLADLTPGMRLKVIPETGTAEKIMVSPPLGSFRPK